MNLLKFPGAFRVMAVTASLALVASLTATPSFAADKPDPKAEATAITQGMTAAPGIIAASKVSCELANARVMGKVAGKDAKGSIYEIACKAGPGFIITALSDTPAASTDVKDPFTCNLLTKLNAKDPKSPLCVLPENVPDYKWLQPVAKTFLPNCEVNRARVIGSTSAEPLIDRYEVGCVAGVGGVIDYPQLTAVGGKAEYKNCLIFADSPSACTFTTKEQLIEDMKPIATAGNAKCEVTDVRFVGVNKEGDNLFYEFGCKTPPGFMVATSSDSKTFVRMVPCASAIGLGGCKFTDAGVAAADANSQMTAALKSGGYDCTVSDYNLIGTQENTKRDYVEFKCPEQPYGLIGFVPQPGSTASVSVTDCFIDQTRRKACTLTTAADLMKQVDKLIKIAKPDKGCDVTEVRYIGESDGIDNGVIAEVACGNKRGYIVVIDGDRKSLVDAIPCGIAKAHKEQQQCTIPGNGTYASAD